MAKTERCCKDVEVFKKELQEIATEMGLPIEDGEVICEWGKKMTAESSWQKNPVRLPLLFVV